MKAAHLSDRGVVKVSGDEARKFLNGLVTVDMSEVTGTSPRFAALLTPQGKIIVDFIVAEAAPADGGGFFLDCPRALAATLAERLAFYRLRAKIAIEDVSEMLAVTAIWNSAAGAPPRPSGASQGENGGFLCYPDPRLPELGFRCMLPPARAVPDAERMTLADYEAHRIALGVPRGGIDFAYGDAFPHEADMDQLHGIDFQKGCFVGQEVVSRMEHRSTARTRVIPVALAGAAPAAGIAITAAGTPVGVMGSAAGRRGLASLRLDRVEAALANGVPLVADGIALRPIKPVWAHFAFPGETKASETKTSKTKASE
jgi:folate-binding protein YgfZ